MYSRLPFHYIVLFTNDKTSLAILSISQINEKIVTSDFVRKLAYGTRNIRRIASVPKDYHDVFLRYLKYDSCTINFDFQWSSDKGYYKCLQFLIQKGVKIHDSDTSSTPYFYQSGIKNGMKHLSLVYNKFSNKMSLIYASRSGHLEIVKSLVHLGVDVTVFCNSAILDACINGHMHVVEYLVSQGADVFEQMNAALGSSYENGHSNIVNYLLRYKMSNQVQ